MANRAFIIPIRNDVNGMGMQVTDLQPNSSQRNLIYDGEGQSGYLKYTFSDAPQTSPITALADDDTTGGGNDVEATTADEYGLIAYLRERVHAGGTASATAGALTPTQALNLADDILAHVVDAGAITVAELNTILSAEVASTDFDGAAALSKSFGSVEELLRILQGEPYLVPAYTIVNNVGGQFRSEAERETLVDAQDTDANGGVTFYATGHFVTSDESYYVNIKPLALTGFVRISAAEGVLAGFAGAMSYTNPAFTYGTGGSAQSIAGDEIDTDGEHAVVVVYDNDGNVLS